MNYFDVVDVCVLLYRGSTNYKGVYEVELKSGGHQRLMRYILNKHETGKRCWERERDSTIIAFALLLRLSMSIQYSCIAWIMMTVHTMHASLSLALAPGMQLYARRGGSSTLGGTTATVILLLAQSISSHSPGGPVVPPTLPLLSAQRAPSPGWECMDQHWNLVSSAQQREVVESNRNKTWFYCAYIFIIWQQQGREQHNNHEVLIWTWTGPFVSRKKASNMGKRKIPPNVTYGVNCHWCYK